MGKDNKSASNKAAKPAANAKPAAKKVKKTDGPKKDFTSTHAHLFEANAADYRIGRDVQPKRDMSRFVKWPRYVRIQRQRAILKKRLKVPPAIHQFATTLDKNKANELFHLLGKYRPESREAKKKRLLDVAKARVAEEKAAGDKKGDVNMADKKDDKKPILLKYGINHVTSLVESKKAKLVVIAHDVDPIEIVVWLPALCRKMQVPYCIVKSKARLGMCVHKKTATVLAITEVKPEDAPKLEQLAQSFKVMFTDDVAALRRWGGGVLGAKAQAVVRRRERAAQRELSKKA